MSIFFGFKIQIFTIRYLFFNPFFSMKEFVLRKGIFNFSKYILGVTQWILVPLCSSARISDILVSVYSYASEKKNAIRHVGIMSIVVELSVQHFFLFKSDSHILRYVETQVRKIFFN